MVSLSLSLSNDGGGVRREDRWTKGRRDLVSLSLRLFIFLGEKVNERSIMLSVGGT
jgi:hypothetical protein